MGAGNARAREFLSTLKVDLYPEEVYTFTPKGRVIVLPRGATPVDFAYTIHTEVGHQCVGAKVNGQMVPLRHPLANGDVVEIVTQKGHSPSRDWLSFVRPRTRAARSGNGSTSTNAKKPRKSGGRLFEREARQAGVSLKKISDEVAARSLPNTVAAAWRIYTPIWDTASIRHGRCWRKLPGNRPRKSRRTKQPKLVSTVKRMLGINDGAILVLGHDDLMVYRAKCCNPIPGDPIVGYVTRGRGVAVHNTACPNVQKLLYQSERRIPVRVGQRDGCDFFGAFADSHGRSPGNVGGHHHSDQRCGGEYPHVRERRRRFARAGGSGAGHSRSQAAGAHPHQHQENPRYFRYRTPLQHLSLACVTIQLMGARDLSLGCACGAAGSRRFTLPARLLPLLGVALLALFVASGCRKARSSIPGRWNRRA